MSPYPLRGVTGDGSVIVGRSVVEVGGRAFIWDQVNGMRDLNEVLAADFGLDLSGWTLTAAWAITPDGTTIVGSGTNPAGDIEGWIAVIPEPGAATLAGMAFAELLRRRR